jgi:zinc/manganese transport system ATP-binding protein
VTGAGADIGFADVTVTYRRVPAVHHLKGRFARGSLTAITGPNGAGKSTLLKAVMGVLTPSEGRIDRGGLAPAHFAYLPQAPEIDRSFPISVGDTIVLGAWPRCGPFGRIGEAERARAERATEAVGLAGYADASIAALSAGQWRRVLFARLIVQDAPVVLLDEPFASLDDHTTQDLMALIAGWHREGRTVVAVLHDSDFIRENIPQTLLLARETIAWGPTPDVLTPDNLARADELMRRWTRDTHTHDEAA